MVEVSLRPEVRERIRDANILMIGVLLGIFGGLIANMLDTWAQGTQPYSIEYIILTFLFFFIAVFIILGTWFRIRFRLYKARMLLKKIKKQS